MSTYPLLLQLHTADSLNNRLVDTGATNEKIGYKRVPRHDLQQKDATLKCAEDSPAPTTTTPTMEDSPEQTGGVATAN
jgi:hypothetical protein